MSKNSDRRDGAGSSRERQAQSSGITSQDSTVHFRESFAPERGKKDTPPELCFSRASRESGGCASSCLLLAWCCAVAAAASPVIFHATKEIPGKEIPGDDDFFGTCSEDLRCC